MQLAVWNVFLRELMKFFSATLNENYSVSIFNVLVAESLFLSAAHTLVLSEKHIGRVASAALAGKI